MTVRDAWVLRLKDDSKDGLTGEYYFAGDDEMNDFVTQDLNDATVYEDKEKAIQEMKNYELFMKERYGEDAICNAGYTNMMQHFDWVEVEVAQ